jgi:DNA-binding transcriptional LysR family regulator
LRLDKLDLNLLVVLDAVMSEGGVTRASSRLHLTQAATSNALRRLREHFNDDLVVLSNGRMVATEFGAGLAERVHTLIDSAHLIATARATFDPAASQRQFRLSLTEFATTVILPRLLPVLEHRAPNIVLEVSSLPDDLDLSLDRGEQDFIVAPQGALQRDYPSIPLFRDEYVCIAADDNDEVSDPITCEEYVAAEHVIYLPSGRPFPDRVARAGIVRHGVAFGSHTVLPWMVTGTRRLATVQRRLAERIAPQLRLKISPLPFAVPELVDCAYWHPVKGEDLARIWMRSVLIEVCANL